MDSPVWNDLSKAAWVWVNLDLTSLGKQQKHGARLHATERIPLWLKESAGIWNTSNESAGDWVTLCESEWTGLELNETEQICLELNESEQVWVRPKKTWASFQSGWVRVDLDKIQRVWDELRLSEPGSIWLRQDGSERVWVNLSLGQDTDWVCASQTQVAVQNNRNPTLPANL